MTFPSSSSSIFIASHFLKPLPSRCFSTQCFLLFSIFDKQRVCTRYSQHVFRTRRFLDLFHTTRRMKFRLTHLKGLTGRSFAELAAGQAECIVLRCTYVYNIVAHYTQTARSLNRSDRHYCCSAVGADCRSACLLVCLSIWRSTEFDSSVVIATAAKISSNVI